MQTQLEKIDVQRLKSLAFRLERAGRIKQARKRAMLTIKEMSKLIGLSPVTYRKVENGALPPRIDNLELLAIHTKTELRWLLYGDS